MLHPSGCARFAQTSSHSNRILYVDLKGVVHDSHFVQDTKCALCPPHPAERKKGARDSAFFRAAKPTEFRGWAHVLCSTFNHELEYTDARHMRLVEGIVSIPQRNYTQVWSLMLF